MNVARSQTAPGSAGKYTASRLISIIAILLLCLIGITPSAQAQYTFKSSFNTGVSPVGIAVDAQGNIYTSDNSSVSVKKFDSVGNLLWTSTANGQFGSLRLLTIDSKGNVLVADATNNLVFRLAASDGSYISKRGNVEWPIGLAVDGQGNWYAANFTVSGASCNIFDVNDGFLGSFGTNLSGATGLGIDKQGNIFVSDQTNNLVQKYDKNLVLQTTFGSTGTGNGQLSTPYGLTVDNQGNVLVADLNNSRIEVFDNNGVYKTQFGQGTLSGPQSVATDSAGNIYVADTGNNRVVIFNSPNPVPTLNAIAPKQVVTPVASAVTLTVTGTNFVSNSQVLFGGTALTTKYESATKLTATIPTSLLTIAGQVSVTVKNPTPGGGTSNPQTFTIIAGPTLDSVSPNTALVGSSDLTVTLTGNNYVSGSQAYWNSTALFTVFVSATQLKATVPATLLAKATNPTANITIKNPNDGGTSAAKTFTVSNPVPTITSLSVNKVDLNSPNVAVTVTGTKFVTNSTVQFKNINLTTTFVSTTQVKATIPASMLTTTGSFFVTVTNPTPGGGISNSAQFSVVYPSPTLTKIDPTSALLNAADVVVTLTGTKYYAASTVSFNGTAVTTTYVSPTQLKATIPASRLTTLGTFPIRVTNPTPGGGVSTSLNFTVGNPVPVLDSLSPASVIVGAPTTTLTLNGSNFAKGATVSFGANKLVPSSITATQIKVTISPSYLTKAGEIMVTVTNPTPLGGTSAGKTFVVQNPVPSLFSINPGVGSEGAGDTTITVTGSDFVSGSKVICANTELATTFVSATQVTAVIPASLMAAPGFLTVWVSNPAPGGGPTNNFTYFMVIPAMTTLEVVTNPTPTLTRSGTNLLVTVLVGNTGTKSALNVLVGNATLNGVTSTGVSPNGAHSILPGSRLKLVLTFPGTALVKGTKGTFSLGVSGLNTSYTTGSVLLGPAP